MKLLDCVRCGNRPKWEVIDINISKSKLQCSHGCPSRMMISSTTMKAIKFWNELNKPISKTQGDKQ